MVVSSRLCTGALFSLGHTQFDAAVDKEAAALEHTNSNQRGDFETAAVRSVAFAASDLISAPR